MNKVTTLIEKANELVRALREPDGLAGLGHCDHCEKVTMDAGTRLPHHLSSKSCRQVRDMLPTCVFCLLDSVVELAYFARCALERGDMRRAYNLLSVAIEFDAQLEPLGGNPDLIEKLNEEGHHLGDEWLEADGDDPDTAIKAFDEMSRAVKEFKEQQTE